MCILAFAKLLSVPRYVYDCKNKHAQVIYIYSERYGLSPASHSSKDGVQDPQLVAQHESMICTVKSVDSLNPVAIPHCLW